MSPPGTLRSAAASKPPAPRPSGKTATTRRPPASTPATPATPPSRTPPPPGTDRERWSTTPPALGKTTGAPAPRSPTPRSSRRSNALLLLDQPQEHTLQRCRLPRQLPHHDPLRTERQSDRRAQVPAPPRDHPHPAPLLIPALQPLDPLNPPHRHQREPHPVRASRSLHDVRRA